ncbi:MAG: hypothetical protein IKJ88_04855 [Clostridia bacterium]|nr:hypothetical protein [Clostridia bacterium]MBR3975171.1 hypothetical protein [Clostridia bacterium]
MNSNDYSNLFKGMGLSEENDEKIANSLFEKLNDSQKQKLKDALNDPQLLHNLMNSTEAQKIISKFSEKEKRE